MYQAGGRITIALGGTRYSPRGKATIDPSGLEHSVNENQDGTVSRSTKAKAVSAELSFDRGQASSGNARPMWDSAFMLQFFDCTILESDAGVLHTFTNASLIGTPKIDTETGEVAGLTIMCAQADYNQTSA